jgi:hypothetical protein
MGIGASCDVLPVSEKDMLGYCLDRVCRFQA